MKLLQIRFIRKLLGAILGSFIATFILAAPGFLSGDVTDAFQLIWLVSTFYMLVVGIPVSYVSDWMANFFSGWMRKMVSAEFHIGGAILFVLMWDTGGKMSDKIKFGIPGVIHAFYGTVKDYSNYQPQYPDGLPKINPNRLDACK